MRKRTWFMLLFVTIAAGLLVFTGCPNGTTTDDSGEELFSLRERGV